jgi:hypothetical protein
MPSQLDTCIIVSMVKEKRTCILAGNHIRLRFLVFPYG